MSTRPVVANPLIASNQASTNERKWPDKKRGIAPNKEKANQPMLTVKKACIQPTSFLMGKSVSKINPKEALKEKPMTKSKNGANSPFRKETPKGINIKNDKPRISLPSILKMVEKSLLSGEIIIFLYKK